MKNITFILALLVSSLGYAESLDDSRLGGYVAIKYIDSINNEYYNSDSVTDASEFGVLFSQAFNGYLDVRGSVRRNIDNVSGRDYQVPYFFANLHNDFDNKSIGLYAGIMRGAFGLFNDQRYNPYDAKMMDLPSTVYPRTYDFFASGRPGGELYYKMYFDDISVRLSGQRLLDNGDITDEKLTENTFSSYFVGVEIPNHIHKHPANLYNIRFNSGNWEANYNWLRLWFTFKDFKTPIPGIGTLEGKTVFHVLSGTYSGIPNWRFSYEYIVSGKTDVSTPLNEKIGHYIGHCAIAAYSQPRWSVYYSFGKAWPTADFTQYFYYKALKLPPYLPELTENILGYEYLLSPKHKIKLRNELHLNEGFYHGDFYDTNGTPKKYWGFFESEVVIAF